MGEGGYLIQPWTGGQGYLIEPWGGGVGGAGGWGGVPVSVKGKIFDTRFGLIHVQTGKKKFLSRDPPPRNSKKLLWPRGGRYASYVHAGGLSCLKDNVCIRAFQCQYRSRCAPSECRSHVLSLGTPQRHNFNLSRHFEIRSHVTFAFVSQQRFVSDGNH